MSEKPQVVIMVDEYGLSTWTSGDDVEVIEFDFKPYDDMIPDRYELNEIKADLAKVKIPVARQNIEEWIKPNEEQLIAIEESEARRKAERVADESDPQVLLAKELLTEKGYKVIK